MKFGLFLEKTDGLRKDQTMKKLLELGKEKNGLYSLPSRTTSLQASFSLAASVASFPFSDQEFNLVLYSTSLSYKTSASMVTILWHLRLSHLAFDQFKHIHGFYTCIHKTNIAPCLVCSKARQI
ncbi:hypothetical protein Ancab_040424 [Ancistrocladus abbreviatus]